MSAMDEPEAAYQPAGWTEKRQREDSNERSSSSSPANSRNPAKRVRRDSDDAPKTRKVLRRKKQVNKLNEDEQANNNIVGVNPLSERNIQHFRAYAREPPPPTQPFNENLRDNPYLKGFFKENKVSSKEKIPAAHSERQIITMTDPTMEELGETKAWLTDRFEELVDLKNEEGIVLEGREKDKIYNRAHRIPKFFIELRLRGLEGFKDECLVWNKAMNQTVILKRREFYQEKIKEVERMMERLVRKEELLREEEERKETERNLIEHQAREQAEMDIEQDSSGLFLDPAIVIDE